MFYRTSWLTTVYCFLLIGSLLPSFELVHEAPDKAIQHYFLSMKGAFEHVSGNTQDAAATYHQITQLEPTSSSLQHASLRLAFERGDYQDVIRKAPTVQIQNPKHKEAAINLAQAYLFSEQPGPALAIFTPLKEMYKNDSRIDYYLGLCAIKANNFDEAHRIIDASLDNESYQNRRFLFEFLKAKLSFLQNDLARASHHVEKSLLLHPRFAKALVLKGVVAEKQGNHANALHAYESYIAMTKDPEVTKKVITLCFATKKFDRARQLLLAQPRDAADYYHDLALLSFRLGDTADAYTNINRSLEKNSTYFRAQDLKTHFLISERKFDTLASTYEQWLRAQPNNELLIRNWYQCSKKEVPFSVLIQPLKKVAADHPTIPLCFALGDLLHQKQHFDAARVWYEMALRHRSCKAGSFLASKLHFQCAVTHYTEKNFTLASTCLQQALRCNPAYPSAHNLAALLLVEKKGDLVAARTHIDTALLAAPKHGPYLETLGQLLKAQGQHDGAAAVFEKARAAGIVK